MEKSQNSERSLKEIRDIMERSATFISLSGSAGVVCGLLAFAGVFYLYTVFGSFFVSKEELNAVASYPSVRMGIYFVFSAIFVLSVTFAFILSSVQAKKKRLNIFNSASKNFAFSFFLPIATAGLIIPAMIKEDQYWLVIPVSLIFYGTALVSSSKFSRKQISQLGISGILCGILALYFIEFSFLLWGIGFGVNNLIAGMLLYIRYDRKTEKCEGDLT